MQTKMSELQNIIIALQTDHDNKEDASKIERKRSVVETRQEAHTSTSLGNSGLHDRCTENSATSGAEKNTSTLSPVQTSMQSNESRLFSIFLTTRSFNKSIINKIIQIFMYCILTH